MPRWLPKVLTRVRELAAQRRVRFTLKAIRELPTLGLGLDAEDACDVLANLTSGDSAGRMLSETTGEWLYVFTPRLAGTLVYVKIILRNECVVVSFHEGEGGGHEENP
jgi:hypothetical protein